MGVHFVTVPAGEGCHHHLRPGTHGGGVGGQVNGPQRLLIDAGISLVDVEAGSPGYP